MKYPYLPGFFMWSYAEIIGFPDECNRSPEGKGAPEHNPVSLDFYPREQEKEELLLTKTNTY